MSEMRIMFDHLQSFKCIFKVSLVPRLFIFKVSLIPRLFIFKVSLVPEEPGYKANSK